MTDEPKVIHYRLLPKQIADNPDEIRRYDCSECHLDIFNLNLHAQVDHGTHLFDVDQENEYQRPYEPPFHPCGILGCTYPPHGEGSAHSWQIIPNSGVSTDDGGKVSEPTA